MPRFHSYSQNYMRQCFDAWYLAGRPSIPARVREIIPENEDGRKPVPSLIGKWMIQGMWDERADELDARAMEKVDNKLVDKKAKILIKHQEAAAKIQVKALEKMLADGFDSSAAAVNAYFRATEEERKTQGFSDLLERLDKMTNNDVEREIREKLQRIKENNQMIEIPENTSDEVVDAE